MIQIVKYNKPRSGSGAVSASGAGIALSSLAGLLTQQQLATILEGYLLKETFDDLFVKEADGYGGYRIKAKYALYSNQYLSCLGNNPDAGTVALGATTLGGLNNVAAAADEVSAAAKVLVREAGAASWTLKSLSDIVGLDTAALATYLSSNGYAKQSWVEAKGYLTQHQSLADYATKTWVEGKGYLTAITKAQVEAVLTGNITSHTHSQYLTSALAAQTYQPIGDYATNTALNSAVSSLNTAIGQKLDTATFDDLFAKESDGHGGYRIKAKYALYSNQYLSCLGNNPDAGTTTPSTPGVDLDAVADYLTQQGYATQAWVQAQGYVTALGVNGNNLTWTKGGTVNNITVPFAAGCGGLLLNSEVTDLNTTLNRNGLYAWGNTSLNRPAAFGSMLQWSNVNAPVNGTMQHWVTQLASATESAGLFYRTRTNSNAWTAWEKILTSANYAATLNSKYVTVDTAQTITGQKKFTAYETEHGSRVTATGLFDTFANWPHFMWHVVGTQWTKAVMDTNGGIHFVAGDATSLSRYRAIAAANFVIPGGTASQILLADGSVGNELAYLRHRGVTTTNADNTLWSQIGLKSYDNALPDGLSGVYNYGEAISFAGNSTRFDMYVNHHSSDGTQNGKGIYYRSGWGTDKRPWQLLLDTNNYASVLDSRYVHGNYIQCAYGQPTLQWVWGSNLTHVVGFESANNGAMRVYDGAAIRAFANAVNKAGDTMTGALSIKTDTQPCLKLDSVTANKEVYMYIYSGGVAKNAIGWSTTYGAYIYNSPSSKYLGIKDNGTPHFQGNTLWHAGNDGSGSGLDADMLDNLHLSDIRGEGYAMQGVWIDASGLDQNTWYPVTLPLSVVSNTRIEVLVGLNSSTKPSWSTHSNGFSTHVIWEANGHGWGTTPINRTVYVADYAYAGSNPVRGIGQMVKSSTEYFYVRGGGRYYVRTSNGVVPVLRTSTYTASSQSVGPTTTAPAEIHRDNARIGDNVASATRLQGTYSLWGQSFYGNNVSGNMTGVGDIHFAVAGSAYINQNGNVIIGSNGNWAVYNSSIGIVLQTLNNGNVGMGTLSPECKLHVVGVIKSTTGMYSDGYMSCLGQNTGSDARLKDILGDVTLPIEVILNAPAVRFAWNASAGPTMAGKIAVGTIAQYWLEPLPEVVGLLPTDYYGLDYEGLNWVATKSLARYAYDGLTDHERRILALERRCIALEQDNSRMRAENEQLRNRLNQLERRLAA